MALEFYYYINDVVVYTVVTEGNAKGNWNNLGTTWIETLKKGDDVCLKVDSGTIDEFFAWWGVRIFAN